MKKMYETPKAIKYEFNYRENVAASLGATDGPPNEHANENSANSCVTQNTSNIVSNGKKCHGNPKG